MQAELQCLQLEISISGTTMKSTRTLQPQVRAQVILPCHHRIISLFNRLTLISTYHLSSYDFLFILSSFYSLNVPTLNMLYNFFVERSPYHLLFSSFHHEVFNLTLNSPSYPSLFLSFVYLLPLYLYLKMFSITLIFLTLHVIFCFFANQQFIFSPFLHRMVWIQDKCIIIESVRLLFSFVHYCSSSACVDIVRGGASVPHPMESTGVCACMCQCVCVCMCV